MNTSLNWGILGTGRIAHTFAGGLAGSKTGRLVAVGSRDRQSADTFANTFNAPRRHGSYDELLNDPDVQAVYISTPHPLHAKWAIKAAQAKKHILCEKPLAMNAAEAAAIVDAAKKHDVFLMEAFMYRCHPQTQKLVELLRNKSIGEVQAIHASFSFREPGKYNPKSRLLARELGGGGILDVGCYPVSMARLIAGAANGNGPAEPIEIKGVAHLGPTGVDEWASAVARFPGNIVATLSTGVQVQQENVVRVYGTEGSLFVPLPWAPAIDGGVSTIFIHRTDEKVPREVIIEVQEGLYSIEADTVATYINRRQAPFPAMSWDDTLGNMRALDVWRQSIGLVYESDKRG